MPWTLVPCGCDDDVDAAVAVPGAAVVSLPLLPCAEAAAATGAAAGAATTGEREAGAARDESVAQGQARNNERPMRFNVLEGMRKEAMHTRTLRLR